MSLLPELFQLGVLYLSALPQRSGIRWSVIIPYLKLFVKSGRVAFMQLSRCSAMHFSSPKKKKKNRFRPLQFLYAVDVIHSGHGRRMTVTCCTNLSCDSRSAACGSLQGGASFTCFLAGRNQHGHGYQIGHGNGVGGKGKGRGKCRLFRRKMRGCQNCLRYSFICLMKNGHIPNLDRLTGNIVTVVAVFTKYYGLLWTFLG